MAMLTSCPTMASGATDLSEGISNPWARAELLTARAKSKTGRNRRMESFLSNGKMETNRQGRSSRKQFRQRRVRYADPERNARAKIHAIVECSIPLAV